MSDIADILHRARTAIQEAKKPKSTPAATDKPEAPSEGASPEGEKLLTLPDPTKGKGTSVRYELQRDPADASKVNSPVFRVGQADVVKRKATGFIKGLASAKAGKRPALYKMAPQEDPEAARIRRAKKDDSLDVMHDKLTQLQAEHALAASLLDSAKAHAERRRSEYLAARDSNGKRKKTIHVEHHRVIEKQYAQALLHRDELQRSHDKAADAVDHMRSRIDKLASARHLAGSVQTNPMRREEFSRDELAARAELSLHRSRLAQARAADKPDQSEIAHLENRVKELEARHRVARLSAKQSDQAAGFEELRRSSIARKKVGRVDTTLVPDKYKLGKVPKVVGPTGDLIPDEKEIKARADAPTGRNFITPLHARQGVVEKPLSKDDAIKSQDNLVKHALDIDATGALTKVDHAKLTSRFANDASQKYYDEGRKSPSDPTRRGFGEIHSYVKDSGSTVPESHARVLYSTGEATREIDRHLADVKAHGFYKNIRDVEDESQISPYEKNSDLHHAFFHGLYSHLIKAGSKEGIFDAAAINHLSDKNDEHLDALHRRGIVPVKDGGFESDDVHSTYQDGVLMARHHIAGEVWRSGTHDSLVRHGLSPETAEHVTNALVAAGAKTGKMRELPAAKKASLASEDYTKDDAPFTMKMRHEHFDNLHDMLNNHVRRKKMGGTWELEYKWGADHPGPSDDHRNASIESKKNADLPSTALIYKHPTGDYVYKLDKSLNWSQRGFSYKGEHALAIDPKTGKPGIQLLTKDKDYTKRDATVSHGDVLAAGPVASGWASEKEVLSTVNGHWRRLTAKDWQAHVYKKAPVAVGSPLYSVPKPRTETTYVHHSGEGVTTDPLKAKVISFPVHRSETAPDGSVKLKEHTKSEIAGTIPYSDDEVKRQSALPMHQRTPMHAPVAASPESSGTKNIDPAHIEAAHSDALKELEDATKAHADALAHIALHKPKVDASGKTLSSAKLVSSLSKAKSALAKANEMVSKRGSTSDHAALEAARAKYHEVAAPVREHEEISRHHAELVSHAKTAELRVNDAKERVESAKAALNAPHYRADALTRMAPSVYHDFKSGMSTTFGDDRPGWKDSANKHPHYNIDASGKVIGVRHSATGAWAGVPKPPKAAEPETKYHIIDVKNKLVQAPEEQPKLMYLHSSMQNASPHDYIHKPQYTTDPSEAMTARNVRMVREIDLTPPSAPVLNLDKGKPPTESAEQRSARHATLRDQHAKAMAGHQRRLEQHHRDMADFSASTPMSEEAKIASGRQHPRERKFLHTPVENDSSGKKFILHKVVDEPVVARRMVVKSVRAGSFNVHRVPKRDPSIGDQFVEAPAEAPSKVTQ